MKRLLIFFLAAVAVIASVHYVLNYFKSERIESYYSHRVIIAKNNFNSTISSFEKVFRNILKENIDVEEVKSLMSKAREYPTDRDKYRNFLRKYTEPIFESMKSVGLTHMHYHFSDGTSFLRMHRPFYFGDDLSFRKGVMKVNETKEFTSGFENGRHLVAYRFIFPLEFEGEHIGSVELSVGLRQLIEVMNRNFGVGYAYILGKDKLFQNYTASVMDKFEEKSISNDYYMERCDACIELRDEVSIHGDIEEDLVKAINVRNYAVLKNYKAFAEISPLRDNVIFAYLPIIDMNGNGMGYIISHSDVRGYANIIRTYRILAITINIGLIFLLIILFVLDRSRSKAKDMNAILEMRVSEKVQELREKEQFFAQQSKMVTMGEMLASIIHQWKQPLNSISLVSDLLLFESEQRNDDPETLQSLKIIKEQALFMSQTGEDFRKFMKPSKEKIVFSITEAASEVIELFQFSFTRYGIEFSKEWDQEIAEKAYIYGYPNELKHVLLNIFNNARDAIVDMREKIVESNEDVSYFDGVITISAEILEESVVLKISDTGGGIPENIISKVFDKHFSTKNEHGSGIGLFMSKEMVVKSMNGKMIAKNIVGGAEFILEFPKAEKKIIF
ncbi:MAG: hypothetical protein C0602_13120 [Denitrovibrio sp.]|nr:MAG: hypothetical protein C0602_13120 [Denitrovibrio sp.]